MWCLFLFFKNNCAQQILLGQIFSTTGNRLCQRKQNFRAPILPPSQQKSWYHFICMVSGLLLGWWPSFLFPTLWKVAGSRDTVWHNTVAQGQVSEVLVANVTGDRGEVKLVPPVIVECVHRWNKTTQCPVQAGWVGMLRLINKRSKINEPTANHKQAARSKMKREHSWGNCTLPAAIDGEAGAAGLKIAGTKRLRRGTGNLLSVLCP